MDELRKRLSQHTSPKLLDKVPLTPCNSHEESPPEEDHRLANWHRRQLEHQRCQKHLVTKLKRKPSELALNAHVYSRAKKEMQCLIEEATKSNIPRLDYSRNFKQSAKAREEKKETQRAGSHVITNQDLNNQSANVTRIALPNFIRKEKMLLDSYMDTEKCQFNPKWEQSDYLRRRRTELEDAIEIIEPKKPETDDLIIIGKNFHHKNKEQFIRPPVITITSYDDGEELLKYPDERIALKIQDREFVLERGHHFEKLSCEETSKLRQSKEDLNSQKYAYSVFETNHVYRILSKDMEPIMWTINFAAQGDELCEKKFILENKGIQTITIDWRKVIPKFTSIPIFNRVESFFFFNKNPVFILPGQIVEVIIWFHSERPIVATETWNLIIEPKIYPGILSIRLWATSNGNDWKLHESNKSSLIKENLQSAVRYNIVRDIVERLFLASTCERAQKEIPYRKLFAETNIFHARNPTHFYNSTLIAELKYMYKNATGQEDWSLILKELHMILLRLSLDIVQNQISMRFNDICIECLQPIPLYQPPISPKRQLVYWLLCTLINKFEDESNFAFNNCCQQIATDEAYEMESASESGENESENFNTNMNHSLYYEIFYVRIYSLMCETIDRISAAVYS